MAKLRERQVDDARLKELILYLATKSETDPRFSSTKLNKLLFYCDFAAFRQLGRPITGHSYQKLQFGPAPKAMLPILDQMKEEGICVEVERDHFGRRQRRVVALRPPQVALFSSDEIFLADQIVRDLWESSASEVSDLSHDFIGWRVAGLNEVIPFETVFVGDPATPVSDEEVEFCQQLALGGEGRDGEAGASQDS
jgi:uncharacterized phage-associated protein